MNVSKGFTKSTSLVRFTGMVTNLPTSTSYDISTCFRQVYHIWKSITNNTNVTKYFLNIANSSSPITAVTAGQILVTQSQ